MMLTHTTRWSHPPGNPVVPSGWQATVSPRTLAIAQRVFHNCTVRSTLAEASRAPSGLKLTDQTGAVCR